VIAVGLLALVPGVTQAQLVPDGGVPRTPWGSPNLQGVWDFRTITPLERPSALEGKELLTVEEAAIQEQLTAEERIDRVPDEGDTGFYNRFWLDQGTEVVPTNRTSLIVDPLDGKLPALTPAAQQRAAHRTESWERPIKERVAGYMPNRIADGPEDLGLAERCLLGFNSGPPMLPSVYNNAMQLFQTPDYVVILNEMVHDARIVPLDGRTHLPPKLLQWMGDSRGHWDGETLVIETTNFTEKTSSFSPTITSAIGSGKTLHLRERLRRLDGNTLLYEYTVNDPVTFTTSFTVEIPMKISEWPLFEYACHEGNYAMENTLAGARAEEHPVDPSVP
jgi:hypothetical protein